MDYKLIRTNRKTVAIQLQKDGSVIVRAPKRLAVYRIEAFVKEKQNWIEQHQTIAGAAKAKGELLPFGRAISTVRSDASDADDPREGALLAANGRFSAGG